jgi:hypothetical protein
MHDIDQGDFSKVGFQVREIQVAEMAAPENSNVTSSLEFPTQKSFAGSEMRLPSPFAANCTMTDGNLLGKEPARPSLQ